MYINNMAKVVVFALFRKHFAMCGIKTSQNSLKTHPFNVLNLTIFIFVCLYIALNTILLKEANGFDKCADILFRSVSISICCIDYVIMVCATSKLFEFINNLADTVNESE